MKLHEIFNKSTHSLELFAPADVEALEQRTTLRKTAKGVFPHVACLVRGKGIRLTPEEMVRQLYAQKLMDEYGYPKERLAFEFPVHFGRETKRADIVVRDENDPNVPYIIVETKKPKARDGRDQLKSYTLATGASMAVWTNGGAITYHQRKNPNFYEDIPDIPDADKTLADILKIPFTMADLVREDKLTKTGKSLKDLICEMEDEVL
ncbi:MAG: type I restriction enzyme HsdR N-terminal domain-containing protein, partial [Kiritimatiellaeota bacterium]|nr:type I restriction enzyme HsdR N-terminal domain-containing protein [Kiritimatiellota bacterium]